MKRFYIAYGSNSMFGKWMRCPDAVIIGTAFIPDYRCSRQQVRNLTIEPHSGSQCLWQSGLFRTR
ncbi:MAG: hypothetical protein ACLSTI_03880 [Ruminococcus sp.]